jgi:hypothetical protein
VRALPCLCPGRHAGIQSLVSHPRAPPCRARARHGSALHRGRCRCPDAETQTLLDKKLTLGVDSFYEQSQNLIDEGQFGAPIILTPFNYRYGLITLRVDVINVADKIYEIRSGTGIGVFAPQYGPRRGFFGGVSWRF